MSDDQYERLHVKMNADTAESLRQIKRESGNISSTEAVRRAIALLRFASDERNSGAQLLVKNGADVREVVFL